MNEVVVETTLEDWNAYQKRCQEQAKELVKSPWWHWPVDLAIWAVIAICFLWIFEDIHYPTAGLVALMFVSAAVVWLRAVRKIQSAWSPNDKGLFLGRHVYRFTPEEIIAEGQRYTSRIRWSAVLKVERSHDHIFLYVDTVQALSLPTRDIQEPEQLFGQLAAMQAASKEG